MSDEQTPAAGNNKLRTRILQSLVVLATLVVATYLFMAPAAGNRPTFDMLAYLDERVASQEDVKDVRCWSSFCKLQMFITGAAFDEGVLGVRIERHMQLIESIWDDARREDPDGYLISDKSVAAVLQRRFPYQYDEAAGATFQLGGGLPRINIDSDSLQDYSDTIEPWRLMQTWASRHTDAVGSLQLEPQFDEPALGEMYGFLRTYDTHVTMLGGTEGCFEG